MQKLVSFTHTMLPQSGKCNLENAAQGRKMPHTELGWRGFLLGESEREKEGEERRDQPLGTGVTEDGRQAASF